MGGASIRQHPRSFDDVLEKFSSGQNVKREKRYIAYGNVLAAYASVGSQGQVINFEDSDGTVRAGILYKKDATRDDILGTSAVSFPDFEAVSAFFLATDRKGIIKSADGSLVVAANGEQFKFSVPASKVKGAQFFLNGKLLEAAGRDFVKSGNSMGMTVDSNTAAAMVGVLREQGFGLVAGSHKEEAREVMGMDEKPMASLADKPRSDDTPVRVVEVDPGIVPEFKKVQDLVGWLKDYYAERREITIKSTGRQVNFSNRGLKESAKRRGDAQRKAYAGLDRLVEEAVYDSFEAADARHRNVEGQEVYYAAMRLGEKLYSVKFKLDVPLLGDSLNYKDHKPAEIEIAPVLSAANGTETVRSQPGASAIREISLGVLRGAVKPSELNDGVLSSLSSGEFLPPRRETRQRLRAAGVRRVADALTKRAKNAVPTQVVDTFSDLPARLRRAFAEQADLVEGVHYDGTVWLVAENITDEGRAADVWTHEQVVHGGLRSLFGNDGVDRLLRQLWNAVGGMGNSGVSDIARRYNLNPRTDMSARALVMEEYLAALAEKRREAFTSEERTAWRRIVRAIVDMWNRLVEAVSGRPSHMGMKEVEAILSALNQYVMNGVPSQAMGNLSRGEVLASVNEAARFKDAPRASLRNVLRMGARDAMDLAEENQDIGKFFAKSEDLSMSSRILNLPHWIAKQFPNFARIYNRQLKRMDERNAERVKSMQEITSFFGDNPISGPDMDALRDFIWEHDGKQIEELEDTPKFIDREVLASGRPLLDKNPEWDSTYTDWVNRQKLPDAAKKAMLEIRMSLDNDLMRAHNRMAGMSEFATSDLQEFRSTINHVHNYFPHHRYGQYYVQARVGNEVVYREHFDALNGGQAKRRAMEMIKAKRAEFPGAKWSADRNERLPDEIYGTPLDTEAMEQVIKTATERLEDKQKAKEIQSVLHEAIADTLKARGWGSHAIGRKGIPGHETQDIVRVLYDYKTGLCGWTTKIEAARDFTKALAQIDARETPKLWTYASQYVQDMLRNYDNVDRVVGNIKAAAFAWYLGGNLKTAVLNLTQNVIVGVPRLQLEVDGAVMSFLKAAQTALVDQASGRKGKGLPDEEARLIQELYNDAVINDAFMEEVRGRMGDSGNKLLNKTMKLLGWPMSVAERFNRASLALAAFRSARGGRLKEKTRLRLGIEGTTASYEQAKSFAEEIVRDSHYVYGKANMPEFLRSGTAGRIGSAMYTFRTFSHNLLSLWHWAIKEHGLAGAGMVAKGLGATVALGGLTAFPFYATAMALFQAATGDDDDWTESIRKSLPENNLLRDMVCYGIPASAGVSLGGSLKMETPLTQGLSKGGTPKEVITDSIGDILGIPYDLFVVKPSKFIEARRYGNNWRALEEFSPVVLKNAMQAWRLYREGQTTMSGRSINDPGKPGARKLNESEFAGKLLGFQPVSSAKSYDAYAAGEHKKNVRSEKVGEIATAMLAAQERNDIGEMAAARKSMKAWNEKMEREGKPAMRIKQGDVQRRMVARRGEMKSTPKNTARGREFRQIWGE